MTGELGIEMGDLRAKLGELAADGADVAPSQFVRLDRILEALDGPLDDGFAVSLRALCACRLALAKAGLDKRNQ